MLCINLKGGKKATAEYLLRGEDQYNNRRTFYDHKLWVCRTRENSPESLIKDQLDSEPGSIAQKVLETTQGFECFVK